MADISKLRLPSGNTYIIKDEQARTNIATLQAAINQLTSATKFIGETSTAITDGATTATISIGGANHTAAAAEIVIYQNKEFIYDGTKWIEFGDLSNVMLNKGSGKNVLGEGATFKLTNPSVSVGTNTRYIAAAASGAAVGADGTASVIDGLGTPTSSNFLTSATGSKKKLVTTSITPTNGTETFNAVNAVTKKKLATTTVPNVTNKGTASSWAFNMGSGDDAETLIISGANGSAPTLGTAITVATGSTVATTASGGATITEDVTTTSKTCAKAGTAVTVATGATNASGTGATIVDDVTTNADAALTGLGTPSTKSVLTGVKMTAQPTIKMKLDTATGTNKASISVPTGAATVTGGSVAVDSKDATKVAKYDDLSISAQ